MRASNRASYLLDWGWDGSGGAWERVPGALVPGASGDEGLHGVEGRGMLSERTPWPTFAMRGGGSVSNHRPGASQHCACNVGAMRSNNVVVAVSDAAEMTKR